ncbi:VTC domain-containing protein [Radiomyces spectabilis]|uniref:VTC domain-containing protein n=1 Tax=Radiomyces spectabilis TaxID=64574 RepID=UPI00221EF185|nr:VTC domain-containing protein [Radiomyces spectabilis]KAI8366829.1 VTC domain-containing protein [Radiomyces spectabilis]
MKFGSQLQQEIFTPWRLSYVQYDVLKNELKTRQLDHEWCDQDERDFIQLLENELNKVYEFITAKLGEVEARISYCERTLQTFMNNPSWCSEQNWNIMDDALTEVLFDVNDLAKFTRLNYIGFQKILKKHDKWTGLNLQHGFIPQLRAKPLDKQRFDVAIVFISALHDICRLRGKPRTGNAAAGGDQNAFERATSKYWIHPDNVTEVKSIIMLHLPVLIFNKDKRYEPSDSAISSVYFDNEDFDLYTGRLQRDEGAEAIRFRWYGPMSSNNIFIERKTHHAAWLNGASVKDRFRLDFDDVQKFITGELTADQYADRLRAKNTDEEIIKDNHFIAQGIQKSFQEKGLKPVCRIFYNRTAFQLPGDQRVRVSLDTDLTFIREDHLDGKQRRGDNEWRRPDVGIDHPFSYLDDSEVLRFPYAVLETKLQTHLGQQPPEWLLKLLDSHLVHEVPRFSKYLHGASYLYRDRIPLLPWWLSEMDIDIRKPRATNFGLTRSKSFKPLIDGQYRRAMEAEERRIGVVADAVGTAAAAAAVSNLSLSDTKEGQEGQDAKEPEAQPGNAAPSSLQETLTKSSTLTVPGNEKTATPAQSLYAQGPDANNSKVSQSASFWDNTPHRNRSTLVRGGDAPRNYGTPPASAGAAGAVGEKGGQQQLGQPVDMSQGDIRLDVGDAIVTAELDEKKPKKGFFGGGEGMYVQNPNNPEGVIPLKKIKVEPKVFFANERTFISWLQFCALLLTVALSLLNFGDSVSRIAGGIFIGISALVAIYALYRFEKRAWMINRRVVGRYDDLWGPAVLCTLLVGALIVNFYLRFR